MSSKMFQDLIQQMKNTVDRTMGVFDTSGTVIACSDLSKIGKVCEEIANKELVIDECFTLKNKSCKCFGGDSQGVFVMFVDGTDNDSENYCNLLAVSMNEIKGYYDEKYDRGNFIKNVILDNILPGDVYLKARELHFDTKAYRVCLFVKAVSKPDVCIVDVIQDLFPEKSKDFVIGLNEKETAIIKEINNKTKEKDLEKLAVSILDTLTSEFNTHCIIGIGTAVESLEEIARSFKEAQTALEVGKVFDTDKKIVNYNKLGIARLIYQLPTTLCDMFLNEVFPNGSTKLFDNEILFTIHKFFENSLNVSETSRKLFIHRNTLVYRLDKIKKITGLDLRDFEDAIVFQVALMVQKYLSSSRDELN